MGVRDMILQAKDLETKEVETPHWGTVTIREWSGKAKADLFARWDEIEKVEDKVRQELMIRAAVVAASVIDEDGSLAFTQEDVAVLMEKNEDDLAAITVAALDLNGMGKGREEQVKN